MSTPHPEEMMHSNASRLREFRIQKGSSSVFGLKLIILLNLSTGISYFSESLLVRDTLFLMQGISGKYVRFASSKDDEKTLVFSSDSVRPPSYVQVLAPNPKFRRMS